jgi:hypothetical protein
MTRAEREALLTADDLGVAFGPGSRGCAVEPLRVSPPTGFNP